MELALLWLFLSPSILVVTLLSSALVSAARFSFFMEAQERWWGHWKKIELNLDVLKCLYLIVSIYFIKKNYLCLNESSRYNVQYFRSKLVKGQNSSSSVVTFIKSISCSQSNVRTTLAECRRGQRLDWSGSILYKHLDRQRYI